MRTYSTSVTVRVIKSTWNNLFKKKPIQLSTSHLNEIRNFEFLSMNNLNEILTQSTNWCFFLPIGTICFSHYTLRLDENPFPDLLLPLINLKDSRHQTKNKAALNVSGFLPTPRADHVLSYYGVYTAPQVLDLYLPNDK